MTRYFRRLVPSPAMVVALTALFVALGGSAYAALTITGKSIRNNTITTKDIRNGTIRTKDVKPDSLGGVSIKESALGTVPSAGITFGAARFAVVSAERPPRSRPQHHLGGAHLGGPLPGDLQRRRAWLRLLRHRRRHQRLAAGHRRPGHHRVARRERERRGRPDLRRRAAPPATGRSI